MENLEIIVLFWEIHVRPPSKISNKNPSFRLVIPLLTKLIPQKKLNAA